MELKIFRDQNNKGLGTTDLFTVIPVGKKGDEITFDVDGGKLSLKWGSNIRDNEIATAIALLSFTLQMFKKEQLDELRVGNKLEENDENGQPLFINSISVKGADASAILNNGDRGLGKRVYTALQHLENLQMSYELRSACFTTRLFSRVAYKKGVLSFDVSHFLINRIAETLLAFRLQPVLQVRGRTQRLALYVETHQRPGGKFKGKESEERMKYYPKDEYSLEELIFGLNLNPDAEENKLTKRIQEDFDAYSESNPHFPKYTYEPRRKVFESEYKNSAKRRVIK